MLVWLLDASEPGDYARVRDTVPAAIAGTEALMADGREGTARVELAQANMGGLWIDSGLTAARSADGTVRRTPFYVHRADVRSRLALTSAGSTEHAEARSRRHASMGPS